MSQKFESFGKYILLEKLAMGGMAEVWLARAPGAAGLGKFVAIKKILPQYSDNQEFIQMFRDEAAIAMNLSHSNIVGIYEFGQENQQLFLVMDYVEGKNLRQILNKLKNTKQHFSADQVIYMIKEVAGGLDHAHRSLNSATGKPLNITHRDMSPQNIMISYEGEVKIVDFGIAKAETHMENTKTGTLKGKFGYMSPEQAEGQATDLRTDIFSLGIVLWELLAKDRLFIANNELNTLRKIRECNVPLLTKLDPNVNAELERIVMKSLTRDKNLRYQTAAALHRDLSRFLNRQYPDFSTHDFSVFIKTLYANEILSLRNRLIEYSTALSSESEWSVDTGTQEKTNVVSFPQSSRSGNTKTLTQTMPSKSKSSSDFNDEDMTQTPHPITNPRNVLDEHLIQKNLNTRLEAKPIDPIPVGTSEHSIADGTASGTKNFDLDDTTKPQGRSNTETLEEDIPRKITPITAKKSSGPSAADFLFFLAFMAGSFVLGTVFFPQETKSLVTELEKMVFGEQASQAPKVEEKPEPVVSTPRQAPTQKILIVNSNPSGANIFLDGESLGTTTPAKIYIPTDRSFQIKLEKERYIEYIKDDVDPTTVGRVINANLQKAYIAYIDIDVVPTHGVNVFVDGKHLKDEKLPIQKYAIPAGRDVIVRVEKIETGEKIINRVRLREDGRKTLRLNFDKERSTSSY